MVGLPGILASGTLPSTLKCAGVLYKLVTSTSVSTRLSVDELRDMVSTSFSSHVCHYAGSLRGTHPYWMKQRSCLIAMVDTLGLPTVFFTHSAADLQWPELANLICQDNPEDASDHRHAVIDNPGVADCFFYKQFQQFLKCFYLDILGAKDYWLRFEWQSSCAWPGLAAWCARCATVH